MALTNKQKTALNFKAFYEGILPYLNGEVPTFANAFNKSDLYSTSEKIIGCWTDGKPLYQRVVELNSDVTCNANAWVTIDNDSYISSIGNIISCKTFRGTGLKIFSIPMECRTNNSALDVSFPANTAVRAYVLQYTKTTDSAIKVGNGNDYSTDEQIIGTWIDGSVLYQKTVVTGGSVPSGATLIERIVQTGYDTLRYTKSS